jgi:hypothetical protein
MPKTLYCNSFEVSRSREAFVLTFRFESPDGYKETYYVTLSPSGVVALQELLTKEVEAYTKDYGNIPAGNWHIESEKKNNSGDKQPYLS